MLKHLESLEEFNEIIAKGVTIVDFYADWCGPCKMLAPHFEEASKERDDVTFLKINVDKFPSIAEKYQIYSIPALLVFKDNELKKNNVGYIGKQSILGLLNL